MGLPPNLDRGLPHLGRKTYNRPYFLALLDSSINHLSLVFSLRPQMLGVKALAVVNQRTSGKTSSPHPSLEELFLVCLQYLHFSASPICFPVSLYKSTKSYLV
jgi:hypothetical protein